MITLAVLAVATVLHAQSLYDIRKYPAGTTSYEAERPSTYDIENSRRYSMYRHPALVQLLTDTARSYNATLETMFSDANSHGDYIHYLGNRRTNLSICAGGEMAVKNTGTLYGHAYYGSEKMRSVYQNYAVRPEDYAPYFVSDSLNVGDVDSERYLIEGGLSMSHNEWLYGISLFYEGINGAKSTQARREIYSYWFRIALNAARVTPRWILSAKIWPEINKQSISASSSVRTFRFMQFYGFGQWNRKESTTGYSYGRDNKILGAGGELLFSSGPSFSQNCSFSASIAYNYRHLQTEETSFKNLFLSTTHHLNHNFILSLKPRDNVETVMELTGEADFRSGEENVYERVRQDDDQSLYDYVKAGTNRLYNRSVFSENFLIKAIWSVTRTHTLALLAGVSTDWYKEHYREPSMTIENRSLTPRAGLCYSYSNDKNAFDLELIADYRLGLNNRFSLNSFAPTQFEIAQAYIPYLLRGENRYGLQASAAYMHSLGPGNIGMRCRAVYSRRTDAPYISGWQTGFGLKRFNNAVDIGMFYIF